MPSHPLSGIKVLELAGLAPVPFAGMVLADFGADVVRVDRSAGGLNPDVLARGKRSIAVSLKHPQGIALIKTLLSGPSPCSPGKSPCDVRGCKCSKAKMQTCAKNQPWRADILLDPFRPGVLERLGLGPQELLKHNPRLIIARLTGYRKEGDYKDSAGHDINYIAMSGMLNLLGRKGEKPAFPANLLGDFAGGGMVAVVGIMMALFEREKSGLGQVIDIDMVTGTRYVSTFAALMTRPSLGLPLWNEARGDNVLDGGAPWYEVYATSDGRYMSVGSIEPQFYSVLLSTLLTHAPAGVVASPVPSPGEQHDRSTWPRLADLFTEIFLSKSMAEWTRIFQHTDACVAPVLDHRTEIDGSGRAITEQGFVSSNEGGVPCPAPTLGRTPAKSVDSLYDDEGSGLLLEPGKDTRSFLTQAGLDVDGLLRDGVVQVIDEEEEYVKSKL